MSDRVTRGNGRKGRRRRDTDHEKVQHWRRLLTEAHGADMRPHCDCIHDGRCFELVVRRGERLQDGRVADTYHVARFPGQDAPHQLPSPFHETHARRNGRGGYKEGVVRDFWWCWNAVAAPREIPRFPPAA